MKRTFDPFIDNGLFVAAYYLNKDIKDLTEIDILNNLNLFAEKIETFIKDSRFDKVAWSAFTNSSLTGQLKKDKISEKKSSEKYKPGNDSILAQLNLLADLLEEGEEHCIKCGHSRAVKTLNITRSLMPGIVSNTFYNYANNLTMVNICPICIILTLLSVMNMRKKFNTILYLAEDDKFMKDFTKIQQEELAREETEEDREYIKKNKSNSSYTVKVFSQMLNSNKYSGFINEILFDNLGQSEYFHEQLISKKNIELLYLLKEKDFLEEFWESNLLRILYKNNFQNEYLDVLIDLNKEQIRCSKELFEIIDERMNSLNKDVTIMIKNFTEKINKLDIDCIKKFKSTYSLGSFEDLIIKFQENYKKKFQKNLFDDLSDFETIVNPKTWKSIRRRIVSNLIIIN